MNDFLAAFTFHDFDNNPVFSYSADFFVNEAEGGDEYESFIDSFLPIVKSEDWNVVSDFTSKFRHDHGLPWTTFISVDVQISVPKEA